MFFLLAQMGKQREIFTLISNKDIGMLVEYYKDKPIQEIEYSELYKTHVSILVYAAMEGNTDILDFYAKQGLDLRKRQSSPDADSGGNLLHDAACICNLDTFKYLADIGLDIQEPDDNGLSPLDIARMFQCPSIEQFILKTLKQDE